MSQSSCSLRMLLAFKVSVTSCPSVLTANLYTSLPFMSTLALPSRTNLNPLDTPSGYHNRSLYLPSECSHVLMIPGSSAGCSSTAPAPSANSTQVPRSFQSIIRVSVSAPTTSAHFDSPSRTNLSATLKAYTNPVQAASMLNAGQP